MNKFFKLFEKHEEKIKVLLIVYALYCSIIIGVSWDEGYYQEIGKINLNYLLSFGLIDDNYFAKFRYSTLYWSFSGLIVQSFPVKFATEVYHIINTFFGLLVVVGLYKVVKKIYNKPVAKISSAILFFTPLFFGHLAINNKDIILAFCHVWIFYYILKYTLKEYKTNKRLQIICKISILCALGTGIQLLFFGSLLPIILTFFVYLIFYSKRDLKKNFTDFIFFLLVFYLILVLFWVDTHSNIFLDPYNFFFKTFSEKIGWPFNLFNGNYILSHNTPIHYLLTNYFYKLPEFVILSYAFCLPIAILNLKEIRKKFKNFYVSIFLILIILIYPNLIIYFIPFPIYDGIRLFLWSVPYIVIIPGIVIYFIFIKKGFLFIISRYIFIILFIFHFKNFLSITPYHYTFLNILNGEKTLRYQRFENDYWSTSLKELILNSNLPGEKITFYSCGINSALAKFYMRKRYKLTEYTDFDNAEYIIMTNRTMLSKKENKITNCLDEFNLKNISVVKRNGIILSTIRKIR